MLIKLKLLKGYMAQCIRQATANIGSNSSVQVYSFKEQFTGDN